MLVYAVFGSTSCLDTSPLEERSLLYVCNRTIIRRSKYSGRGRIRERSGRIPLLSNAIVAKKWISLPFDQKKIVKSIFKVKKDYI